MTINEIYQEARNNPQQFLPLTGVDDRSFSSLLSHFRLSIPLKLNSEMRLFAALYQEKHQLSFDKIGKLLGYTNLARDGKKFVEQAQNALAAARIVLPPLAKVIPTSKPEIKNAPAQPKQKAKVIFNNQPPSAPILISYRNEQGTRMHGAFYDHYTIRHITQRETYVSTASEQTVYTFNEFVQNSTFSLGINDAIADRIIPVTKHYTDTSSGLLVIPGRAAHDNDKSRQEHEQFLIAQARKRGQPVLAICAGSWRLWSAFGGTLKEVSGHLYSQMPYIVSNGGIGNNKQIHRIRLTPNTLVHGAMFSKNNAQEPTVNSVHWMVPDFKTISPMVQVSAMAVKDESLRPKNRQGEMHPEHEIEAFETRFGAPMIGVQWHPEAYYNNKEAHENEAQRHLNIIRYMAKAGDAFQCKRKMMEEFHHKKASLLTKHGLFNSNPSKEIKSNLQASLLKK